MKRADRVDFAKIALGAEKVDPSFYQGMDLTKDEDNLNRPDDEATIDFA
jgi:hypothetical protein